MNCSFSAVFTNFLCGDMALCFKNFHVDNFPLKSSNRNTGILHYIFLRKLLIKNIVWVVALSKKLILKKIPLTGLLKSFKVEF